jgi:PAS domain S-box-containing protein
VTAPSIIAPAVDQDTLLPEEWLTSHEPAYCRDISGNFLAANEALCRRLGKSPEELRGLSIRNYVPPEDAKHCISLDPELTRPPYRSTADQRWITVQGERWFSWQKTAICNADDEVIAVRAIGRDITRQRQADEQYFKLAQAVEQSPLAIAITDTQGHAQYANAKFTALTDSSLEEILDGKMDILRSVHKSQESYEQMMATVHDGREWAQDTKVTREDNSEFWESIKVSALKGPRGEVTNLLCLRENITAQKQLEMELRQAQKMDSLGTLAGGIAHDFNNLLAIISGYAELCIEGKAGADTIQKSLLEIRRATQRARGLVRQILTFSRKTESRPAPFDLNNQVAELVLMMQETFPRTVQIINQPSPGLPDLVADQSQIQQVILNLSVNARDAMPGGGTITVKTGIRHGADINQRKVDPTKRYICIEVTDTGTGMSPEVRQHIFEPFYTTKKGNQGTGLGLSVVYGIATGHNGFLEVDSVAGEGSTFRVFFPEVECVPEAVVSNAVEEVDYPGGTESILVVDDEAPLRTLLQHAFRRKGYQVSVASTGLEAIEAISDPAQTIDVMLLDLNMPGASGFDVLKIIRQVRPGLKVLVLTGHLTSDALEKLQALGQKDYLAKPYQLGELGRKLRDLIDRKV